MESLYKGIVLEEPEPNYKEIFRHGVHDFSLMVAIIRMRYVINDYIEKRYIVENLK